MGSVAVADLLRFLEPGHVYELRAMEVPQSPTYACTVSGFFDDLEAMSRAALSISERGARAVYYTPNPLRPEILARRANRIDRARRGEGAGDADVLCRRWLLIDCDPVRASGISSNEDEHGAALEFATMVRDELSALGWPAPMLCDSGNGAHLMYRVDLPNDEPTRDAIAETLRWLDGQWSNAEVKIDRSVYNAGRIWKFPGTWSRKGDEIDGRRHRRARVLEGGSWADLEILDRELLRWSTPAPRAPRASAQVSAHGAGQGFISQHWPGMEAIAYQGGYKWVFDVCPFDPAHDDRSAVVIESSDGSLHFRCHHTGCAGRGIYELREQLGELAGIDEAIAAFVEVAEQAGDWQARLIRGRPGRDGSPGAILPIAYNVQLILREDPRWAGVLAFDTFASRVRFRRNAPWFGDLELTPTEGAEWQDLHEVMLKIWLSDQWRIHVDRVSLGRTVYAVAKLQSYSPVVEYLDACERQSAGLLDTWLVRFCGAQDGRYTRLVGRWWLMSLCARAYEPGCKFDYVLILEGEQGIKKSSVFEILASTRFFSNTPVDIGNKDAFLSMRGKWIVEMAELDSLNRVGFRKARSFFTSPVDTYRPPYGRETIDQPRQCGYGGTTNESQYLSDPAGGRRFWPVRCGIIDDHGLQAARDALWAEARDAYRAGQRRYPCTEDEHEMCRVEQALRYDSGAWDEIIEEWISVQTIAPTLRDVMDAVLELQPGQMTKKRSREVAQILRRLGYEQTRVRQSDGSRPRRWIKNSDGAALE